MKTQYILISANYAINILNSNMPIKIHSVYENIVNLIINNKILALQTHNTVVSPISLITNTNSFDIDLNSKISIKNNCIDLNSKISIKNNCIFIDDFCFD